jgi:hypothetical protein
MVLAPLSQLPSSLHTDRKSKMVRSTVGGAVWRRCVVWALWALSCCVWMKWSRWRRFADTLCAAEGQSWPQSATVLHHFLQTLYYSSLCRSLRRSTRDSRRLAAGPEVARW